MFHSRFRSRSASGTYVWGMVELGGEHVGVGLFGELAEASADAAAGVAVGDFLLQKVADHFGELLQMFGFDVPDILLGEALGVGAFEQPGGGPPMFVGGVTHGVERAELGGEVRAAELFVEIGVPMRFATDRAGGAADIACGAFEATTGGDEGGDFAEFHVVERARAAGGRRRVGRWEYVHGSISDCGLVELISRGDVVVRCICSRRSGIAEVVANSNTKVGGISGQKFFVELRKRLRDERRYTQFERRVEVRRTGLLRSSNLSNECRIGMGSRCAANPSHYLPFGESLLI